MTDDFHFETVAIHAGQSPDPATGAVMTPIYQTSTFVQDGIGIHKGFEYSRSQNPTRLALEKNLAAIEGAESAFAFASGMAAIDTLLHHLQPGDHILAGNDLYGGTFRLFESVYRKFGIAFEYADPSDPVSFTAGIKDKTRMVWLETPTNPQLLLSDILEISSLVKALNNQIWIAVDNTFATPYLQRPLALGADIVMHSTTKYLGGHSDLIGGALVTSHPSLSEEIGFLQNAVGAVPGPLDCFLTLRGIKTLHLRMERHAANALSIARFLESQTQVSNVYYPGLESHPQHTLAKRQMRNGGGMVTFTLRDGVEAASRLVESTSLFQLAESLGGVESLIEIPAKMTHASVHPADLPFDPGLIRLSVGIEAVQDLIGDLQQALEQS
jgi:cystathionine beta-lyase/cystathionine gamma-synthase